MGLLKLSCIEKTKMMNEIATYKFLSSLNEESLRLILFPTEQCNFRCIYCYEDFSLHNMYPEVVSGIKNLIRKRIVTLKNLSLSFFGGEPLLNKKLVIELSAWAKAISSAHNVNYSSDITTNGYGLNESTFEQLIRSGVQGYQVTLDGEEEVHNKFRPTVNGKPTFKKILHNLLMMADNKAGFRCTVRFNVCDDNFDSVQRFVEKYHSFFENDARFYFSFHPIFGMESLRLSREEEVEKLRNLAKSFQVNPVRMQLENDICYAATGNSFVIRADGRVQKCTVHLEKDINNLGWIREDGTLDLDAGRLKQWLFAENKSCPLKSFSLNKMIFSIQNEEVLERVDS